MMRRVSHILMVTLLLIAVTWALPLSAKVHVDDIYDMSLDENIMTPEIKNNKQADKIQEFQYNMAVAFKQANYDVEIMRDDEVIVVTIPPAFFHLFVGVLRLVNADSFGV